MQLTLHADYSLRILLYLVENPGRFVSTREISEAYGISRNHLVRVVQTLNTHGYLDVTEGRRGGMRLAHDPASINLGQVVRKAEPGFRIVECFDPETNTCPIVPDCRLRGVLTRALESFFSVLDGVSLADLARPSGGQKRSQYLNIVPQLHSQNLLS
jgi:Rrf2 family nitric oxide-sensitive transcriptional repressor